ncbi:MAG: ABC transporter substrate-binding protein [Betaproteobacteria bacterium]
MLMKSATRLLLAAAFLLPLSSAHAQLTKLRVSTIPIIDTAPMQAAIAKGFFAAEGLEIDTTPTAGGAAGLPALAAGQVQITFSNIISIVLGAKQGLGFEVIAAGSSTGATLPDLAGIIAKKGSTMKTGKDLEGKRLAVNTRNNIIWLYARAWVQATGGNPDAVTYLEVPFPQMIDALNGDRVDAAFVVEPFLSRGLKSDAVLVGWPYNTVHKEVPVGMYAATREFIQKNPAVIEKFTRAYNKGADWINQNKGSEEWLKIISGYTRMPPELLKGLPLPQFEKTVNVTAVGPVVDLMRKHAMLEGAFDIKALFYKTSTQVVK